MTEFPAWLNIHPLTDWPGRLTPAEQRRRSGFSAPLSSTRALLQQETGALRAAFMVVELAIPADQFRIDGRPRVHARPEHPGVVLSLPNSRVGPLRYATDVFTDWRENLRGIALGLQALRRVERYGIARHGEQYTGFRALPVGDAGRPLSEADCLLLLSEHSGMPVSANTPPEDIELAYRAAVKRLHPDRGGHTGAFQHLQDAIRLLRGRPTGGTR